MLIQETAYTDDQVRQSLTRVASTFDQIVQATGPVNVTLKDSIMIHPAMQVQFNTRFDSEPDRSIAEIIVSHALEAERMGPGSFTHCLQEVIEGLRNPMIGKPTDTLITPRERQSRAPCDADIKRVLTDFASVLDDQTQEMLMLAIDAAGFAGRVVVEQSRNMQASLEHVVGYTFALAPAIDVRSLHLVRPRIFCIDGIIEEVAEIHHLLEGAAEAKEPALMFVRGMSDDVGHTLKVNFDRGSLCVIPIPVRFDFDGINTLADISVVTGADIISEAKGNLISTIKFADSVRIDAARTGATGTILSNSTTRAAVEGQISKLRKKRAEQTEETVTNLYDVRLRSLSANHVIIRLPNDKKFVLRSQAIDRALRAIRSLIKYGISESGELISTDAAAGIYSSRCLNALHDLGAVLVHF